MVHVDNEGYRYFAIGKFNPELYRVKPITNPRGTPEFESWRKKRQVGERVIYGEWLPTSEGQQREIMRLIALDTMGVIELVTWINPINLRIYQDD